MDDAAYVPAIARVKSSTHGSARWEEIVGQNATASSSWRGMAVLHDSSAAVVAAAIVAIAAQNDVSHHQPPFIEDSR
jgi:hypothetical protein